MPGNVYSFVNQSDTPVDIPLRSSVQGGDQAGNSLRIAPYSSVQSTLQFVDYDSLKKLQEAGKISWNIVPTVPEVTGLVIRNKTARRIAVARRQEPASPEDDHAQLQPDVVDGSSPEDEQDSYANDLSPLFVISALGSREIEASLYPKYQFEEWKQLNLIAVYEPEPPDSDPGGKWALVGGCSILLLILFLLIAVPIAIFAQSIVDWPVVGIGAAVLLFVSGASFFIWLLRSTKQEANVEIQEPWTRKLRMFLVQLAKISLVAVIGFGLPALTIYLFGSGVQLLQRTPPTDLALLGRILQLTFIAIASTLPALLYFLFGRLRLDKLRDSFRREAMMLDPDVTNESEAAKYDSLFDSVYGYGSSAFEFLPVLISTILITLGWTLTLLPIGLVSVEQEGDLLGLFTPQMEAIVFGFLGAYFFSINMIYRRYVRADLTTKTYTYISIRIIITTILVWAISSVPNYLGAESNVLGAGILAFAFLVGVIPESGTVYIQDFVRRTFGGRYPSLREDHPLTNLEGVSLYDRARLLEEGIDNIENLAHHDLMELVASTRIPTPRLVDLFDQAILYIHLGLDAKRVKETRQILQDYGVRTATDLLQVSKRKEAYLRILEPGSDGEQGLATRLEAIIESLKDDEWMGYLCNWRNATMKVGNLNYIDAFYPSEGQHPCELLGAE